MSDLEQRSFFAVLWNSLGGGIDLVLSFIISVILSQLLTPADFGTVAIVTVIYALSLVFMQFGFEAALIQKKDVQEVHFNSVFSFGLCLGLVFSILLFSSSSFIANYYEKPILDTVAKIMSCLFIMEALIMTQKIHMKKFLQFKKLNIILISSKLIAGSMAIIMAFSGYGLWSLVTQIMLMSFFNMCLVLFYYRINLKLEFSRSALSSLWETNIYVFLSNLSTNLSARLDTLIIGKSVGLHYLGLFDKGKNLSQLAKGIPSRFAMKPLFSTLSDIQDDKIKLTKSIRRILSINAFVFTPFLLFVIWFAEDIIYLVYGEQWIDAAPFLQLFMVISILYILRIPFTYLLLAKGNAKTTFGIDVSSNAISILIIAILAPLNVILMIKALILVKAIEVFLYQYYGCQEIDFTIIDFLKANALYYVLAIGAFLIFDYLQKSYFQPFDNHGIVILTSGAFLAVVYLVSCFIFNPSGYRETIKLISTYVLK